MFSGYPQIFILSIMHNYLLCVSMLDDWAFIVCFLQDFLFAQTFLFRKCIFINHPPGVGMQRFWGVKECVV